MFKQLCLSLFITLFFAACLATNQKGTAQEDIYLPKVIQAVQLGMSQSAVLKIRPKAYPVNSLQETPRNVFTEDFEGTEHPSIYYLFAKSGDQPLVEINIQHTSPEAAEKTITTYFGTKQKKQNQWHKTLKDGTLVHATWRKNKVLIYMELEEEKNPEF